MNDNMTESERAAETLFSYLKHGNDDHQAWLKIALYSFFQGKECPPVKEGVGG